MCIFNGLFNIDLGAQFCMFVYYSLFWIQLNLLNLLNLILQASGTDLFCDNLVDFNEGCLHEATLNLHTNAWILSPLLMPSVDGNQHLSEVMFGSYFGFSF